MNRGRIHRLLGLAGIALFLVSAFTPMPNVLSDRMGTPARLEPADAIVVLGSGLQPDGALNDNSLQHSHHGISLYRRGLAPLLVFSGEAPGDGPAEAEVRAELAREMEISPDAIMTVTGAQTTQQEAVRVAALLRPKGVRSILLVASSQHMVRARGAFERVGLAVFAAPVDDPSKTSDEPEGRLRLTRQILQEILARLYYRIAGYV